MKYIMIETQDGAKLPFIFPEAVTHQFMAAVCQHIVHRELKSDRSVTVSAGFVGMGNDITVTGESESLGGLKHNPADAGRIMFGAAVQFMPDSMVDMLFEKLMEKDDE